MSIYTISEIIDENKTRIRDFLCLLHIAETYEKKNDPETFNSNGLSFHQTMQTNPIMEVIEKILLWDEYGFTKLFYALFRVGQDIQNFPSPYEGKGSRDIYEEIGKQLTDIHDDNGIITQVIVSKRPWVLYGALEVLLHRIDYHVLLNNIDKF